MFRSRIRWLLGTMMVWRYACLRKTSTTTVQAFSRLSQARQGNARLDRLYPCRSTGRLHAPLAPIDHRSYFGTLPSTRHFSTQNDLEQDNDHYHGSSISTNEVEDHADDTALRYWMDEHGLNAAQGTAVTQPLAAITRVVAGPGSGKTRVLTCRIAHLLETAPCERVLAVTFTRKAAGEMRKRLERLLQEKEQKSAGEGGTESPEIVQESDGGGLERSAPGLDRVTLGTFHSVCGKMLRWNGDLLATLPTVAAEMAGSPNSIVLDGSYVIIDQAEQLRVLKECLVDADINLNDHKDIRPFSILNAISTAKSKYAEGGQPFKKERTNKPLSKIMQITSKVYPFYRQRLFSSNCVDFDDLIFLSRELLMAHGDVRERLQRRWSNILVDEFQDTSKTQMDLIKLLTSSSLFVVGDADQSIYSWRGAHVGSLNDLETEFRDYLGGVRTVYLMENYRSTSNIVKAAQKVISSSEGDSKSNQLRQDMKPKRGAGPAPRVIACADDKAEGM
jgi:DNA helicase-2/ATP-dependent DNA helicase PcrA